MSVVDKFDVSALFGLEPERVIEYLDSKGLHVGWNWQDTLDEAHARSFTIAKMAELDLLSDTRKAIMQAIQNGKGYKDFEQTIAPVMQAKGWWGYQVAVNPDGDAQLVKLGTPRRLATIYHTNRRTAVMAAKYERMCEAIDTHPFWAYQHNDSAHPRLAHVLMNGAVYAATDPIWARIFPPNGFHCHCSIRALTAAMAKQMGISTADLLKRNVDIGLNRSTGEIYQTTRYGTKIPEQNASKGLIYGKSVQQSKNTLLYADAGFNGCPSAGHLMDQLWLEKAKAALGDDAALNAIARNMSSDGRVRGFLAWARTTMGMKYPQNRTYGVGVLSAKAIARFAKELPAEQVGSPVVAFQDHLVAGKKVRRHESVGNAMDLAGYERIVRDFGKPDYELWDVKHQHIIYVFAMPDSRSLKLAVGMSENGAMVDSSFYVPADSIDAAIKGGEFVPLQ